MLKVSKKKVEECRKWHANEINVKESHLQTLAVAISYLANFELEKARAWLIVYYEEKHCFEKDLHFKDKETLIYCIKQEIEVTAKQLAMSKIQLRLLDIAEYAGYRFIQNNDYF